MINFLRSELLETTIHDPFTTKPCALTLSRQVSAVFASRSISARRDYLSQRIAFPKRSGKSKVRSEVSKVLLSAKAV
jgi:hypothetical protein